MENNKEKYFYGLGRRKTSIAKVRLYQGKGNDLINDKEALNYLKTNDQFEDILSPLKLTGNAEKFYFTAKAFGGGISSQTGAIRLGIARALLNFNEELKPTLRKGGFLTRDPRIKERKKPGLHGARKKPQSPRR